MDQPLLSEVILTLGTVPLAQYGTPTTPELAEAVRPHAGHDGILLANHGALTAGRDLFQAYDRMETLEHSAHIYIVARVLGTERPLSAEHVAKLKLIRERTGFEPPVRACLGCPVLDEKLAETKGALDPKKGTWTFTQEQLVDLITDVVKGL
jgi:L-fuculose-phosphate aldolase